MPVTLVNASNDCSGLLTKPFREPLGFSVPASCFHLDLVEVSRYGFYFQKIHYSESPSLRPMEIGLISL